jgi:hypothetical protein
MKINITIECNNAAFENAPEVETARILRELARKVEQLGLNDNIPIIDMNGNKVGKLEVEK